MKKVLVPLFVLFVVLHAIIAGCKNNPAPAGPSGPSGTATVTATCTLSPTITCTPSASATVTPTITPNNSAASFDFESGTQGWGNTGYAAVIDESLSTARAHGGASSIMISCSFTNTNYMVSLVKYFFPDYYNFKGKTFSAWIYVPATMGILSPSYSTRLYMCDLSGWHYVVGPALTSTDMWQNITISVPDDMAMDNYIQRIEFWVCKSLPSTTPDWTGIIYLDDVSWF